MALLLFFETGECGMILRSMTLTIVENFFFWKTLMTYARRITVAIIGLLAVISGSKWLFDGKRLPTLGLL